jgi:hypothetical protein
MVTYLLVNLKLYHEVKPSFVVGLLLVQREQLLEEQ